MTDVPEVTIYCLAAGLSVFSFVLYIGTVLDDYRKEQLGIQPLSEDEKKKTTSALFRILRPPSAFFGHLVAAGITRLQQRYGDGGAVGHLGRLRVGVQRALVCAGNPEGITADEMIGVHCVGGLCGIAVGAVFWSLAGVTFPTFICCVVGLVYPSLWLRGRMTKRRNDMRKILPYALDLLTLSVEAGLDFTAALARMTPKLGDSPLAEEFGEMLRQIRLGRSRREALREMADRAGMGEVTAFCSSLIQADELGADLGPVLRVLADQMRQDRSNRAEKKAMEAPVKILFPLIAFIFPTVFIILFGPIGIKYLQDLVAH
jgi:tight adherence protein C